MDPIQLELLVWTNYILSTCLNTSNLIISKTKSASYKHWSQPSLSMEKLEILISFFTNKRAGIDSVVSQINRCIITISLLTKSVTVNQPMQVLTGKTRLPDLRRMGKSKIGKYWCVRRINGKSKDDFGHGYAKYITFMNIMTNVIIDCQTLESVSISQGEKQNTVSLGDLFFNGSQKLRKRLECAHILIKNYTKFT